MIEVDRRTRAWLRRAGIGGALALAAVAMAAMPAAAFSGSGQFVDRLSGQCIAVDQGSFNAGAKIEQYECIQTSNQYWLQDPSSEIDANGLAYFSWINENSGQCIGVGNSSLRAGALVKQWPCYGAADQHWALVQATDDGYWDELVNLNSGMCLGVPGGTLQESVWLVQWYCNGSADQHWHFTGS